MVRFPVFAFFERSLRVETRSALMCWARVGLLGVIFLVMLPMQATFRSGMFGAPGLHVFESIIWIDFIFLSLAGLSYFATAIAEEKEEMTLGLLRMTNLNPVSILLGKSTSRLIGVGMLLLVQLPVTLLAVSLGGVATRQILAAYCSLLAYAFFVCNLALFCSVVFRRSVTATFCSGVLLLGFFWVPNMVESILKGMSVPYQINLARGGWAIVMRLARWGKQASPTGQINHIFTTGFADAPIGFQVLSNVGLGLAAFLVSWMLFERFTREQKEDAPVRAPFLRRTGRASRVPAYVVGANALTWKDSVFLGGGRPGVILKFVVLGVIMACFDLFLASVGGEKLNQTMIGGTMVWGAVVVGGAMLAFEISRLFKSEVQYKTLASLVLLPINIPELAYRKIAGCLLGLLPVMVYFVLGMALVPDGVREVVHDLLTQTGAMMILVVVVTQYILFLHIVAALSLLIKRGALPLAFVVHYIGGIIVMVPLSIGMFTMGSGDAVMVLCTGVTVTATVCIHYWIGTRLTRLAAEE
jgi:ABC-type transport system involved in multi-copper enzyme maturation permease subunit